jgi:hypothetical protein
MTRRPNGLAPPNLNHAGTCMTRSTQQLLLPSFAIFAGAFALRLAFFWDVKPVSWDETPPQNGALEAAFLLLSIENIAAIVCAITLVLLIANSIKRVLPRTIR